MSADISEEHIASIFRVIEAESKHSLRPSETSVYFQQITRRYVP
jgi:hypothetical protein